MELQWKRQVECWLGLMGAAGVAAAARTVLVQGQDNLYLEALGGRALLATARPLPAPQRTAALMRLLTLLLPEAADGLPLRAWLAGESLWLAATAAPDSGAEQWYALAQTQRRLLARVTEASHVAQ